ncbi:MAG: efflux RND transporter periplasmic adaptor subunit [Acidobacteria bacterium]|nr:efflux RND transporter periplasmic adaptor subunit [Acidobacteriota bacterium]
MLNFFLETLILIQAGLQPSQGFEIFPLTGQVEARQEMRLSTQSMGEVEQIAVVPGHVCAAGDLVLVLRDAGQKERIESAQRGLEAARAAEEQAQRQVERLGRLQETGAVSTVQLEQARLAHQSTLVQVQQAEAALKAQREALRYLEIRAPFAGQVTEIQVAVCARVAPGQVLARLIGPEARAIRVSVPGRLESQLDQAQFELRRGEDWVQVKRAHQTVSYEPNGNLLVYLTDVATLTPYQRVDVHVLIPKQGLFLSPGTWEVRGAATFVWVDSENGPVRRLVKLGPALPDGRREVLAGLVAGEPVRLSGGQL